VAAQLTDRSEQDRPEVEAFLEQQIPETGAHGIRLRDELELEIELG